MLLPLPSSHFGSQRETIGHLLSRPFPENTSQSIDSRCPEQSLAFVLRCAIRQLQEAEAGYRVGWDKQVLTTTEDMTEYIPYAKL